MVVLAALALTISACTGATEMSNSDLQSSVVQGDDGTDDADAEGNTEDDPAGPEADEDESPSGTTEGDESDDDDESGDDADADSDAGDDDTVSTTSTPSSRGTAANQSIATIGRAGASSSSTTAPAQVGDPAFTPNVWFGATKTDVGSPVQAYWTPDPGIATYAYRATIDGAGWINSSVTGSAGGVSSVTLTPDRPGTLCLYVTAIVTKGITAPGWTNSAESSPACITVTGVAGVSDTVATTATTGTTAAPTTTAPPVAYGALPAPSAAGPAAYDGAGVLFSWNPLGDPNVAYYAIRVMHKGAVIFRTTSGSPSLYHVLGEFSSPGQYCAGAHAVAVAGSGATDSTKNRICITI